MFFALAQPNGSTKSTPSKSADAQSVAAIGKPELVRFSAAASHDLDLRSLPYIPSNHEAEPVRRMRHRLPQTESTTPSDPERPVLRSAQAITIPSPLTSFDGLSSTQSDCGCLPPDTDGDVGPNHYIHSVNSSIKIFDKSGNALNGTNGTTYNSFFSPLGSSTPCGDGENQGDGFVFYDHIADRWVVSDFAFPDPDVSASPNYQCIGVSKTNDPVSGGWWLYVLQVDPSHPTWIGDYPKFGLWPDAYYLSVNMFDENSDFTGVRVYALPRAGMINGTGAPSAGAVAFSITPATLGDTYSLVPATFRAGSPPPAGTPEYFMAINSPASSGVTQTKVFAWKFHVDFATPANSTFGIGATHLPNGSVTVNGFVDAFTTTTNLVPQTGTSVRLDTLGDKIMTPLVYQNLGGTESLWATHTINNNQNGTGPTAIRWYQFNVTGGVIPATPAQQQTFNNGGDGLWRFMPSIAVDGQGNMAINYSVSASTMNPAIRYAGRLAGDTANTLAQGETDLIQGGGHQTHSSGRWGDYSMISVDPADNLTFWLTNEYYASTSSSNWRTRVGSFKFGPGGPTPTPTPSPTATPTPTPGASVVLNSLGAAACQNFNGLSNSNASSTTPAGWTFSEADNNADTTYAVGTGSSGTGDTYSFGAASSSDRAFGGVQSGSLVPTIGAAFTNNTGQTITSALVSYTGEQWRIGALGRTDRLDFQISTNATSLTTGTWTDVNALDFVAPVQTGSVGALDGNSAPNRTAISSTINGLAIPNGASFWIRWTDLNATGADDGLGVDDFCLTPNGSPQPPSITNGPPPSPVVVGSPYSFTYTASGNPAPTFSVTGGVLPPGLMLSSSGTLSGTATSGGTGVYADITVTASNGNLPNATQTFSLTTATRATNYIASFGLSGNDAVLTVDYDSDSLTNLMEYGLGLSPTAPDLSGLPMVMLKNYSGTLYLSMTFHRSSLASDLTYVVRSSGDLVSWTDLASSNGGAMTSGIGFVEETGSAPNYTVEVRDIIPYDPNNPNKRFMRLIISTP